MERKLSKAVSCTDGDVFSKAGAGPFDGNYWT